MLSNCVNGNVDEAYKVMAHLWKLGYSPEDIITIVFRVCKTHDMPEFLKLEFIKVYLLFTFHISGVTLRHQLIIPLCIMAGLYLKLQTVGFIGVLFVLNNSEAS